MKKFSAYETLGLEKGASKERVNRAFHRMSLQHHPDKGGSDEMMQLLNKAREELLQQVDDTDFTEESVAGLNELLKAKVPEEIDEADKRLSVKFRAIHADFVAKFQQADDLQNVSAYTYFDEFKTDIYCDVEFKGEDLNIVEHVDLFDLLAKLETSAEECDELAEFSQPLTPQSAVDILIKYVEGRCFGANLFKAQQLIKTTLKKTTSIHPAYNLYAGVLGVLSIQKIIPGQESNLLSSLNQITEYIRTNTQECMPYMALLLQNAYYRTLFSQAVHLFWKQSSRGFKAEELIELTDPIVTKNFYGVSSKRVLNAVKEGIEDDNLLLTAAYLKKLYEYEQFIRYDESKKTAQYYRSKGFDTLDWLTTLLPFASRSVLVNILLQAGMYFQQASLLVDNTDLCVRKADEKLALQAYTEANAMASRSAPDLELYTFCNTLRFIAAFRLQDDEVNNTVKSLQNRVAALIDVFPVFVDLQTNINFVQQKDDTLKVMRSLLQALVTIVNNNKSSPNKITIDHNQVTVLYQAYEACVKNWYQQYHDLALENKFRLELMQLLMEDNDWRFSDIDANLVDYVYIKRDADGWMEMTSPLRIYDCGVQTYSSLEGVLFDTESGEVSFSFNTQAKGRIKRNTQRTLTVNDIVEMLDKSIMGAWFSLDPVDPTMMYHPFNVMRFSPEDIYETQFLNTMLLADYILKFLTTGQEVQGKHPYNMRPIQEAIRGLPKHLQRVIEKFHASKQGSTGSIHRFWIEAEQITEALHEPDSRMHALAITDIKMVVKKHTMERDANGNLVDTLKDNEGWDIYILTPEEKLLLDSGRKNIAGPAMVFVTGLTNVWFIEDQKIYKQMHMSKHDEGKLKELEAFNRDENGKVIVTIYNSMFIYRFVEGITYVSEVPNHFSPEYVFAQEFTDYYDEFSEYILEFARLRELCKITSAIRFLSTKKLEAEHKLSQSCNLLLALPKWEETKNHPCYNPDYFDLPPENADITKEARNEAIFRHNNQQLIRSMLPDKHLQRAYHNVTQASASVGVANRDVLTLQLAKMSYEQSLNDLTKIVYKESRILDNLRRLGLASEAGNKVSLEDKCLWVPASVRHHVAQNSCLFIYGGVRVQPRINVINASNPRYNQVINSSFGGIGRAAVGSSVINGIAQRTGTGGNGATANRNVHARVPINETSFVKGVAGESAQYKTMRRAGYEPQPCKVNGNQGFDGVFVKRTAIGQVDHIVISEAKYSRDGKLHLATTSEKGAGPGGTRARQMSPEWVSATYVQMKNSRDPQVRATAELIRQNRDKLVYKASVLDPSGVNRWKKATEKVQKLHESTTPQARSHSPT